MFCDTLRAIGRAPGAGEAGRAAETARVCVKVLVTGGCGFIGSHTCEHFRKRGWEVAYYDNMT